MKNLLIVSVSLLQALAFYDWQWTLMRLKPYLEEMRIARLEWLVIAANFVCAVVIWIIVLKVAVLMKSIYRARGVPGQVSG